MHIIQEKLAAFNAGITIFQVDAPGPDGLNFGSLQCYPSLKLIFNEIKVPGLAVLSQVFSAFSTARFLDNFT
jgi:hypothetical protein